MLSDRSLHTAPRDVSEGTPVRFLVGRALFASTCRGLQKRLLVGMNDAVNGRWTGKNGFELRLDFGPRKIA